MRFMIWVREIWFGPVGGNPPPPYMGGLKIEGLPFIHKFVCVWGGGGVNPGWLDTLLTFTGRLYLTRSSDNLLF